MKKFIMMDMIAACLALCAAVWPQTEMVRETPTPPQAPAVSALKATVEESETEVEAVPTPEEEKVESSPSEPPQEAVTAPEPAPTEPPTVPEIQPLPESKPVQNPASDPAPAQTEKELQPGDMVYVAGFGWVPYEGPNRCEDGTDIYENGNKIGIMG